MRRGITWSLLASLTLLLAACGGDAGSDGSTGGGGTTKKLNGSVCGLLTATEVASATKVTQTLTPVEGGGGSEDRVCNYTLNGTASVLGVSLQGELEPVDWDSVKAVPGAVTVNVSSGEARYLPSTNILYVYKNGLAAVLLLVVAAEGETPQVTVSKLAQPVANKLP